MPGSTVATEWHLQQSPTMRDSPDFSSFSKLAWSQHHSPSSPPPPYILHSLTHTHTHVHKHIHRLLGDITGGICPPSLSQMRWSGANTVSINRLGLQCCDDMQGAQMGESEVDSHDMSRPDKGYLTVLTSLVFTCPPRAHIQSKYQGFWKGDTMVVWLKLPVTLSLSVQYFRQALVFWYFIDTKSIKTQYQTQLEDIIFEVLMSEQLRCLRDVSRLNTCITGTRH